MKITSRLDYALSCVLRVAEGFGKKKPVTAREVAQLECLETDYVEQLLIAMRKKGIVKSIRGASGGYVLVKSPTEINALAIVEAINSPVLKLVCEREKGRRKECSHKKDCQLKDFWLSLGKVIEGYLDGFSLADLLKLRKKERSW